MKKFITLALATILAAVPFGSASAADRYLVNLTREDSDLYKIDGEELWVQTRYCYEYAYGEQAALSAYEVEFLDSEESCDVSQVLGSAGVAPGTYEVSLRREGDNLYSARGGVLIRTRRCFHFGFSEDAVLRIASVGRGFVFFVDRDRRCDVEAVLSKVSL